MKKGEGMERISKQKRKQLLHQQMELLERGAKICSGDELPAYVDAIINLNRELPETSPFLYKLMELLSQATGHYINKHTTLVIDTDIIVNLTHAMVKLNRELSRIRPRIVNSCFVFVNLCSCFHKKIVKFLRGF